MTELPVVIQAVQFLWLLFVSTDGDCHLTVGCDTSPKLMTTCWNMSPWVRSIFSAINLPYFPMIFLWLSNLYTVYRPFPTQPRLMTSCVYSHHSCLGSGAFEAILRTIDLESEGDWEPEQPLEWFSKSKIWCHISRIFQSKTYEYDDFVDSFFP